MWKYFKDKNNEVWAFLADGSQDAFIKPGLTPITEAEADELRKPPPPSHAELLAAAKAKRDALLSATDWYVIRASEPDGKPIPDDVLAYRQALREIDQKPGWPENVNWPLLPE